MFFLCVPYLTVKNNEFVMCFFSILWQIRKLATHYVIRAFDIKNILYFTGIQKCITFVVVVVFVVVVHVVVVVFIIMRNKVIHVIGWNGFTFDFDLHYEEDNKWPQWLKVLLGESFFETCELHRACPKYECKMYCLDCMNGALCTINIQSNKDHRVVQVPFPLSEFKIFLFVTKSICLEKKGKT